MGIQKKRLSKEEALQKLRHYCAYQERCHQEVKEKLYSFGLYRDDVDQAISILIEENYLNEERFACAFVGGYFRSKHWGRVKIMHALKQKGVSAYCIKKGMQEIDEDAYNKTIRDLVEKKMEQLKGEGLQAYQKKFKVSQYMMQRGFETPLVQAALADLAGGQ
ncbi:MAG: regulatory protein RecX [Chitinophagaceae bacterium]